MITPLVDKKCLFQTGSKSFRFHPDFSSAQLFFSFSNSDEVSSRRTYTQDNKEAIKNRETATETQTEGLSQCHNYKKKRDKSKKQHKKNPQVTLCWYRRRVGIIPACRFKQEMFSIYGFSNGRPKESFLAIDYQVYVEAHVFSLVHEYLLVHDGPEKTLPDVALTWNFIMLQSVSNGSHSRDGMHKQNPSNNLLPSIKFLVASSNESFYSDFCLYNGRQF
ncbi:hypothetical protein TNIN_75461 [Trichonephila inaurata madagascariensis]|uniref:Uncharacterized protein n=1 Tax=Trichonephila inaurata madagascariensis TaxID=2747483 RepID=A0A8X6WX94_9ARAC|nr:hypothetical protein TNIN_75461 [Trichonephila inaurata madagascariensis]